MFIQNITCEFVKNSISIDCQHPRFSWEIVAEKNNVFQKAWQMIVRNEENVIVWDSGVQETPDTTDISYQGEKLKSTSVYHYQITVWTNTGEMLQSGENYFETAFFDHSDWKAKWMEPEPLPQLPQNPLLEAKKEWQKITEAMMHGDMSAMKTEEDIWEALPMEPYDPAVQMRRVFRADKPVKRARLYVTSHGIYEVKINGKSVTDSRLNPGFTAYDRRLKYQVYNVDELVQNGENAISVTVADGWYKGKIALGHGCEYGEVPGALLQLEMIDENGKKQVICSDENWKYSFDGPVRSADLFLGETYDARRYDGEPSEIEYDDKKWLQVRTHTMENPLPEAQISPLAKVFEEVPAQSVFVTPNGETVVDFGQNLAGTIRVKIQEEIGTEVKFEHGEMLDGQGNFFYVFAGTSRAQEDIYICGEKREEIFEPHFTYHGFRYVRVTGGADWKKEDFTALAISTENEVTGNFQCSDEQINQLQSNIYWSQRSNNITIPTDCPTREKAGWTGDVVVYGATALYNQNMTAFYEDWLRSIRLDQLENGYVLGTVPQIRNYVQQGDTGSLGWGDVILTLPLQLYQLYGDKEILQANYEAMEEWMQSMERAAHELPSEAVPYGESQTEQNCDERSLENQRYLINTGFHFGDWIIPSVVNEEGFTDGPASAFLTMNYVGSSLLAADADMFSEISELVGNMENAEKYCAYANRVRQAFEEEYVSEDGKLGQEMQGNYILALRHHMVSPEKEPLLAERLNELVVKNGFRLDTGFMATPHILDILCQYGYADTAWKVLLQKQCPSWLYEVEQGATTVWENWDAVRPDGKLAGCSFNHYAFGCVGDFLYRKVLGIQNTGIGYDKILIAPEYDCPFKWAEGTYHSVNGNIELRWEKNKNQVKISGRIPANTSACLKLPDGTEKELGNGWFEVKAGLDSGIKE